jgi:hypothetical protein
MYVESYTGEDALLYTLTIPTPKSSATGCYTASTSLVTIALKKS